MAIPLRKIPEKGNKPYQRRPVVERLINDLERLSAQELVQQCTDHGTPVPFEVSLYFLRKKTESLAPLHFKQVFTALFTRLDAVLKRALPDWKFDKAQGIRQEVLDRLAEMLAKDRNGDETRLDFYEVNFNSCFANLRKDVLRQIGPAKETDPLENASTLIDENDDATEISSNIENKVLADFALGISKLDDSSFRFRLYAAINDLPDDERDVIGLLLQGMPIEAKDPNVCTISKILQCAVKTVNNRLNRAYTKLRAILPAEDEL